MKKTSEPTLEIVDTFEVTDPFKHWHVDQEVRANSWVIVLPAVFMQDGNIIDGKGFLAKKIRAFAHLFGTENKYVRAYGAHVFFTADAVRDHILQRPLEKRPKNVSLYTTILFPNQLNSHLRKDGRKSWKSVGDIRWERVTNLEQEQFKMFERELERPPVVFPNINTDFARTGRFSSSAPNLSNLRRKP